MSINSVLAGAGAFASRKPIPKLVKLPTDDGEVEIQVYFLDLPAADVRQILSGEGRDQSEQLICRCLCNEDGTLALEMDGEHGAASLKLRHLTALAAAAIDVLGLGKEAKEQAKKG